MSELLNWQVRDDAYGSAIYAKRTQAVRIGDLVRVPHGDTVIRVEQYTVRQATEKDTLMRVTPTGYLKPVPPSWFIIEVEGPVERQPR